MDTEVERELFRIHRESQDKYTYFLLAAAGAAIGFAVTQTKEASLAWSQLPLGVAVLCWGASFVCGCTHLAYVSSTLYANAEMLRVQGGQHPNVGQHPASIAAATEGILKAIEHNSNKANLFGHWQFRSLGLGATFYIGWHVLEMHFRSLASAHS